MNKQKGFPQRTFKFPAELVTVVTSNGAKEVFSCKDIEVPINRDGEPVVNRLNVDAHGNLRLTVSEFETRLFGREYWSCVIVNSSPVAIRAS